MGEQAVGDNSRLAIDRFDPLVMGDCQLRNTSRQRQHAGVIARGDEVVETAEKQRHLVRGCVAGTDQPHSPPLFRGKRLENLLAEACIELLHGNQSDIQPPLVQALLDERRVDVDQLSAALAAQAFRALRVRQA